MMLILRHVSVGNKNDYEENHVYNVTSERPKTEFMVKVKVTGE